MAAESKSTRSHICGFIRQMKKNEQHGNFTFRVLGRAFILPLKSTFGEEVLYAHENELKTLLLFQEDGRKHPTVTGAIWSPTGRQQQAAGEGLGYDEIVRIESLF